MWMVRLRHRLRSSWWGLILAEHDTEPVELAGGITKILVGGWLLLPMNTLRPSLAYIDVAVAPEWAWGLGLVLIGIKHLSVLRNGRRDLRRIATMIGFLIWFIFSVSFFLSNPAGIGPILFLAMAAGQGWCYIRLGRPSP